MQWPALDPNPSERREWGLPVWDKGLEPIPCQKPVWMNYGLWTSQNAWALTRAYSPPGLEWLNYSAHKIRGSKFQNHTHTSKLKLQSDPQKTMSVEYVYYCQHIATIHKIYFY